MKETPLQVLDEGEGRPRPVKDADWIGELILRDLGRPPGLCAVQVRALWDNKYRVNVFAGETLASARITDSFFVVAGGRGRIVETVPAVTRQY